MWSREQVEKMRSELIQLWSPFESRAAAVKAILGRLSDFPFDVAWKALHSVFETQEQHRVPSVKNLTDAAMRLSTGTGAVLSEKAKLERDLADISNLGAIFKGADGLERRILAGGLLLEAKVARARGLRDGMRPWSDFRLTEMQEVIAGARFRCPTDGEMADLMGWSEFVVLVKSGKVPGVTEARLSALRGLVGRPAAEPEPMVDEFGDRIPF